MRVVVFGPERRVGVWEGDRIVDLNRADPRLPSRLAELIARGPAGIEAARAAVEKALRSGQDDAVVARDGTRLHAPCVHRPRIGCAAGNYAEHALGSARRKGFGASAALEGIVASGEQLDAREVAARTRERARLRGFWKDFALPTGPDDDIAYPKRAEALDYEGEVAVVLGTPARDVPAGRGAEHIWGVTLFNDLSIRGEKVRDSLSFNLSKNFDGSAALGPCVVVGELDPADIDIETRVNGALRQRFNSGDMIFTHAEYIEFLSRDLTLLPGDLIAGGSGPGTATDAATEYLSAGDVVEISSPRIGVLRNRIVAAV
ncbi:MAG TPA: fumarylacetoacetate hydrolase family protein [Candidatus Limnocylindria bacterium]|nr:fumarylacetoacetate hydrolase family protein [Candidatus Limnocylindria bacterium]